MFDQWNKTLKLTSVQLLYILEGAIRDETYIHILTIRQCTDDVLYSYIASEGNLIAGAEVISRELTTSAEADMTLCELLEDSVVPKTPARPL